MKMVINRYNHTEVAFCAYLKCKWPLPAVPQPLLMFHLASGSMEDSQMSFSEYVFRAFLQTVGYSTLCWLDTKLRPLSPCYLSVCSENFFTEVGIMSIIAYSSVYLQTGLSSLQSYCGGHVSRPLCYTVPQSIWPLSLNGNCFLLHISVTGDLWIA